MRTGEETSQQLDDHIVMTQAMSFSPYKKPFEMRIATWENKLRITQDVMEEWFVCAYTYVHECTCMYVRRCVCINMHVCMYIHTDIRIV